jgi:hypothetical protein
MKASLDNRIGTANEETFIDDITIDKAILLLRSLDGKKHTMLSLTRENKITLCIGGGNLFFIVTLINKSGDSKTLLKTANNTQNKMVEICAGGQFADFPDKFIVDFDVVKKVVENFYLGQEDKINWEED